MKVVVEVSEPEVPVTVTVDGVAGATVCFVLVQLVVPTSRPRNPTQRIKKPITLRRFRTKRPVRGMNRSARTAAAGAHGAGILRFSETALCGVRVMTAAALQSALRVTVPGAIAAKTPLGRPVTVRVTAEEKPFWLVTVTAIAVVLPPMFTSVGAAVRLKLGAVPTVKLTGPASVVLPPSK